ncbi:hypothetical protein [Actinoplanes sp. NPDC026623]|uniref:hypothetical protein n=1 Tax=Actinoplanes sp. NPDC026623 TaxID=3155610 RepID=UPI0033F0FCF6
MPRMTTTLAVAASGLALFSASACANNPGHTTEPAGPTRAAPSGGAIRVDDQPIPTVASAASGQVPLPWRLIRVDPAQNRIYVDVTSQNCSSPQAVVVEESATTITLTALGTQPPTGACAGEKRSLVGYVTPRDPVGGLEVRHGDQ